MLKQLLVVAAAIAGLSVQPGAAQTLGTSQFRIEWQVVNRFRFFSDPKIFKMHENAWRQYLLYVDNRGMAPDERDSFVARTSVVGSEHVLNDRYIAFSNILRDHFDWRGWAARAQNATCYDSEKRNYSACGGIDAYLNPDHHDIEMWIAGNGVPVPQNVTCQWRIGGKLVAEVPCTERVSGKDIALPYPGGAEIAVNAVGESPIISEAAVKDVLIAGIGDSFASGEGNPNIPVQFSNTRRFRNFYPLRERNDGFGGAEWTDRLCHRSLYGQHIRAALQIAVENPQAAITFLDYSCSGASIDEGVLGPQSYVERVSEARGSAEPSAKPISGSARDSQLYRVMRDLCRRKPVEQGGVPLCPGNDFRRPLDFVFLSIGGNDIGFSNIVAWASLRDNVSSAIASFFGATVSATEFARRMRDVLPDAYGRLAQALERSLPLYSSPDGVFDPSRVILTAYPDLVTDESGNICEAAPREGDGEDRFVANQSLDMFSSWLTARASRLQAVRQQFALLHKRMRDFAGDHGWTFAGRIYADRMFEGHGFCAQNIKRIDDPAEQLMIPCFGRADRDTQTCQPSYSGEQGRWRPYDPAMQNYPYALRQRWVRTFNDAYMVVNQKVTDRFGKIDERASAAVFSETTGALHPSAEGHAAMADSLMLTMRPIVYELLYADR
jgi:lysophospholipase L1-like esterase